MIRILKSLLLILVVFSLIPSHAQEGMSFGQWKKQNAIKSINHLSNGVLLVRLGTMQTSIDKLEEGGRTEDAEKIRTNVKERNDAIMQAFKDGYNFTPYYFFYSQYSDAVKEKRFDEVEFLNAEGENVDPEIDKFLVAYFGTTQSDTTAYYGGYRQEVTDTGVQFTSTYYSSKNMGISAMIIMSPEFVQLTDPFPYYVRTYESLPLKRSMAKTVKKMNGKLESYYRKEKYNAM